MKKKTTFQLIGHDCPLGSYPSIVVPVIRLNGQIAVLYSVGNGPEIQPISEHAKYVVHSRETAGKLSTFDYTRDGLFAFGEQSVVIYQAGREPEFFSRLLRTPEANGLDPFYRF